MEQQVLKYTFNDPANSQKIIEAFTLPDNRKGIKVTGNKGDVVLPADKKTKRIIEFFENEGFTVDPIPCPRRRGKSKISGIRVTVKPFKRNNYETGAVVSILCSGKDEKALLQDTRRKKNKFYDFIIEHEIPRDRFCDETSLGCEYKFC